jgi:hypothetical protein
MKRKCDNCGIEYESDERNVKRGWGLCCSKSCAASKREKSKKGYNPKRVAKNNVRRLFWNGLGIESKPIRRTSEGYRVVNGVAYDEFDNPVYNVDINEDAYDHGQWND